MSFGAALGPLLTSLGSAVLVTIATEVVVAGLLGFNQLRELGIVALVVAITANVVSLIVGVLMFGTGAPAV